MEKYSQSSLQVAATRVMTISHLWVVCFTLFWAVSGGISGYGVGTAIKFSKQNQPPPRGMHLDPEIFQFLGSVIGVVLGGGIAYLIAVYLTAFLRMIVQVAPCVAQIESNMKASTASNQRDRHAY